MCSYGCSPRDTPVDINIIFESFREWTKPVMAVFALPILCPPMKREAVSVFFW